MTLHPCGPGATQPSDDSQSTGCSAIHTNSRRLAIRSVLVEANVRRLGHPSHVRMLAVFSGHGPSRESTLRRSDKSEAASLTSVERSAYVQGCSAAHSRHRAKIKLLTNPEEGATNSGIHLGSSFCLAVFPPRKVSGFRVLISWQILEIH